MTIFSVLQTTEITNGLSACNQPTYIFCLLNNQFLLKRSVWSFWSDLKLLKLLIISNTLNVNSYRSRKHWSILHEELREWRVGAINLNLHHLLLYPYTRLHLSLIITLLLSQVLVSVSSAWRMFLSLTWSVWTVLMFSLQVLLVCPYPELLPVNLVRCGRYRELPKELLMDVLNDEELRFFLNAEKRTDLNLKSWKYEHFQLFKI